MKKRILSLALISCLLFSLAGCNPQAEIPDTTQPSETEPTEVTEEPTPTLSWENTEPTGPIEWTTDVHSGIKEDSTFNSGTLFIGDSLTYGLVNEYLGRYGYLGQARYMSIVGVSVMVFFDSGYRLGETEAAGLYSPEFEGMYYAEAVASVRYQLTAIYLMLGTNYNGYATEETYIQIVDYLLRTCPNATVYLQLIPYTSNEHIKYEKVNQDIQEAYQHYQDQGNERVMLIDTYTAIHVNQKWDGVHLNAEGMDAWYMAILGHARSNNVPE